MISFRPAQILIPGALLASVLVFSSPAAALPLVGITLGGDVVSFTQNPGGLQSTGASFVGRLNAVGMEFEGSLLKLQDRQNGEAFARFDVSPIPMLSLKPGFGVAYQDLFTPGTLAWSPGIGLRGEFSPILMPFSLEGDLSAIVPLSDRNPIYRVQAGLSFALMPFSSLHFGLRSFQRDDKVFLGPEIGLRIGI
ncbi:MAG TPA: hypothetical protein DD435_00080 [Cyanobacteria bacterium UBA8530]|nr:hypothetical protein [Cyanobacteria bacterium UBA8530]